MLGLTIWWSGIALELLLLVRGLQGKLLARYPVFYAYILFVWLQSLLRFSIYHSRPELYSPVYWFTEGLGVLIGCGVVFAVYRAGLAAYPGTARMARNLLGFVFVMAVSKTIVGAGDDPPRWVGGPTGGLGDAFGGGEGLSLFSAGGLFFFFLFSFWRK